MTETHDDLRPGTLLRRPGPPTRLDDFPGIVVHDRRLEAVLSPNACPVLLYEATLHGEGTVWDGAAQRLLWSDVPNRRLLSWRPDGQVDVAIDATDFMNGNAIGPDGHIVHCEHGRRCISQSVLGQTVPEPLVTHYDGKRLNSPNDLVVASDGTIWFTDPQFGILMPNQGSLAEPELDHCSVYRFDRSSRTLTRMADFVQPNGLAFSPDGRTLYVTDTAVSLAEIPGMRKGPTHDILAFDVASDGSLSNRRQFHRTNHGYPDGIKTDDRGWVWTTAGDGIHILDAAGQPLGFIPTELTPSNLCFGGPGGKRLFIAATKHLLALDLV